MKKEVSEREREEEFKFKILIFKGGKILFDLK